ncbi:hypothetical protein N7471_000428, partial [Penicillium samsonianum]|uniref:uncharacterized protein n=1 Tax=Penicillium samsonianum TaxID=1882272 RepID=UPI00254849F9
RHERVALVGLAGVGLAVPIRTLFGSQLIQLLVNSHRVFLSRARINTGHVGFWIHASNAARLEQCYQQIAAVVEIPGRDDPKMNILQLVYQWLCDPRNGRWLMVLDNADDDGIFFSGNTSNKRGPLVTFLPSILITSRLTARNLVGSDGHMTEIQPINKEEQGFQSPHSRESEEDKKALNIFRWQSLRWGPILRIEYLESRSPSTFSYSVISSRIRHIFFSIRTLKTSGETLLSFKQIRHNRLAATELLALIKGLVRSDSGKLEFKDTVALLISYSLVRVKIKTASFDIHRLTKYQKLLPHTKEVLKSISDEQKEDRLHTATISSNSGRYLLIRRIYKEAEFIQRSALEVREKVLRRKHPSTLISVSDLSNMLSDEGKYEEAEAMHRRDLEGSEKVLRREHPDTLNSVSNLGSVLSI